MRREVNRFGQFTVSVVEPKNAIEICTLFDMFFVQLYFQFYGNFVIALSIVVMKIFLAYE